MNTNLSPSQIQDIGESSDSDSDVLKKIFTCCCPLIMCGCIVMAMPILLGFMGFIGINPDGLLTQSDQACIEDCLQQFDNSNISFDCSENIYGANPKDISTTLDFLTNKGLTKNQAIGITANLIWESAGLQSSIENEIGAYGIAQWLYGRKTRLFSYATEKNQDVNSLNLQLEYLWWELQNTHNHVYKDLTNSTSIREATDIFLRKFEIPSTVESELIEELEQNRLPIANQIDNCISTLSNNTQQNPSNYLDVIYYNQQDYKTEITEWNKTIAQYGCGLTSGAMVSSYLTGTEIPPDTFYTTYGKGTGPNILTAMENATGLSRGEGVSIGTEWDFVNNKDANWTKIKNQIDNKNPIVIFTGYQGGVGHIMVIVGLDIDSNNNITDVIVHDPLQNFYTNEKTAEFAKYPFDDFNKHITTQKHQNGTLVYYLDHEGANSCQKPTLKQKIGQLLMVNLQNFTSDDVNSQSIGGLIMMGGSPSIIQSNITKISEINSNSTNKPLISSDVESGNNDNAVNRLVDFPECKIPYPDQMTDPENSMTTCGQYMKSIGFSMNLAPVVDDNSGLMGLFPIRAFGNNSNTIIAKTTPYINGLLASGILPTIKHYPGYGNNKLNSDTNTVTDYNDSTYLEENKLPFQTLKSEFNEQIAIMMSNIIYQNLDPNNHAVLSPTIVSQAREGFDGIIISDDLNATSLNSVRYEERGVKALLAGVDILLYVGKNSESITPQDTEIIINYIYNQAQTNAQLTQRIEESFNRVSSVKEKFGLASTSCFSKSSSDSDAYDFSGYSQDQIDTCVEKCSGDTVILSDTGECGSTIVETAIELQDIVMHMNVANYSCCADWASTVIDAAIEKGIPTPTNYIHTTLTPKWVENCSPGTYDCDPEGLEIGTLVSDIESLQPGDIITFHETIASESNPTFHHTGIMGEGDTFYDCSGDNVTARISKLSDYYIKRFAQGRRICSSSNSSNTTGSSEAATCSDISQEISGTPNNKGIIHPIAEKYNPSYASYEADSGSDINVPANTPVRAIKDGVVMLSDDNAYKDADNWSPGRIRIKHNDGTASYYTHLNCRAVEGGDTVKAGQNIGKTGWANTYHLHFSYYPHFDKGDLDEVLHPCSVENLLNGNTNRNPGWGYDKTRKYDCALSDNVYGTSSWPIDCTKNGISPYAYTRLNYSGICIPE